MSVTAFKRLLKGLYMAFLGCKMAREEPEERPGRPETSTAKPKNGQGRSRKKKDQGRARQKARKSL